MNVIINEVNNVFNVPSAKGTGLNGLHQINSWLDNGYTEFHTGNLSIDINDNIATLTYDDVKTDAELETIICAALYQGLQDKNLAKHIALWGNGLIAQAQDRKLKSGISSKVNIPSVSTLTAFDFAVNCLGIAADRQFFASLFMFKETYAELDKESASKEELSIFIQSVFDVFPPMTDKQIQQYQHNLKQEKETSERLAKYKTLFEKLESFGIDTSEIIVDTIDDKTVFKVKTLSSILDGCYIELSKSVLNLEVATISGTYPIPVILKFESL